MQPWVSPRQFDRSGESVFAPAKENRFRQHDFREGLALPDFRPPIAYERELRSNRGRKVSLATYECFTRRGSHLAGPVRWKTGF